MENGNRLAFYCEGKIELEPGKVLVCLAGYNRNWFGESHLPLMFPRGCSTSSLDRQKKVSDDYTAIESDLQKVASLFCADYFFDPQSKKMKLSVSPKDFPRIVGKYLHSVTSHVECGIPE